MNQRRSATLIAGLILAAILGYMFGSQDHGGDIYTIESYVVAPDRAEELKQALRGLFPLSKDGHIDGSVQLVSGNTIVVKTTKEMQTGVRNFIKDFSARKPAVTPIKIEYWMVSGGETGAGPQEFGELGPVIETLKTTKLDKAFSIVEHSDLSTLSNEAAESTNGTHSMQVKVTPVFADNKITGGIKIDSDVYGKLETDIRLTPGEFVVLGQNSFSKRNTTHFDGNEKLVSGNIYHVVRASVVK